jgi:hypothetical protein
VEKHLNEHDSLIHTVDIMKRKQIDQSCEGSENANLHHGQHLKPGDETSSNMQSNNHRVIAGQFASVSEGILGAAALGLPSSLPFDAASLVQLQAQQQLAQLQSPANLVNALQMNPSLLGSQINSAIGDQNHPQTLPSTTDQNNLALSLALSNATDLSAAPVSNNAAAQDFNSAMLAQALGRTSYGMSTPSGQVGAANTMVGATANSTNLLQSLGMSQSFLGQNPYAGLNLSSAASLMTGLPGNPVAGPSSAASKALQNGLSRSETSLRHSGDPTPPLNENSTQTSSSLVLGGSKGGTGMSTLSTGNKKAISHVLYMICDNESLSDYQCLVRKQIEFFEATSEDVDSNAQGRNKQLVLGQVGIRCRHCSTLPPRQRTRGAMYYPAKLLGIYQAAQNLATSHLCEHCNKIPNELKNDLRLLRERKSPAGGGKQYWGDGARALGVRENEEGYLCFVDPVQAFEKYQKQTTI